MPTVEELARQELLRRIQSRQVQPIPQTMTPVKPTIRSALGNLMRDVIDASGIGGGYRQGLIKGAQGMENIGLDFTPAGIAMDVQEAGQALGRGDLIDAGISALGVVPVIGDVAKKGAKTVSSALRGLDRSQEARMPRAIGNEPLPNAPTIANIPNVGSYRFGPNQEILDAAGRYSESSGVPYQPVTRYVDVDIPRAESIAREYALMEHNPSDPVVQRAYQKMIEETKGQYDQMLREGIKPYFIGDVDPYASSPYQALIDVAENRRLGIFPTRAGFGSDKAFDPRDNPLLAETGYTIDGRPVLANDMFRAVHDYFGHAKSGVGFRAKGEENAYQSHAGMYSPEARRALSSETRGQNSWLNYGPYGETNRTAGIGSTIFADQKTGLLPRWATEAGLIINDDKRERFFDALRRGETGLEGAITDDGKLRIIHWSNQPLERVDPSMYGKGLSGRSVSERNRSSNPEFINRSYYGIPASERAYQPELGIGRLQNEVLIEPELIYDVKKDVDNLVVKGDATATERNIADKNYTGYFVDDPKLGKVAAIFDPYDVAKTYMIPIVAGLGAMRYASALRDVEQEQSSNSPQPEI